MDSNPTLHDFVLNLITNQDARLAFELDPQGSLNAAGLDGLTPADVHDVVPLVFDLAPVQGLNGLPALNNLPGLNSLPVPLNGLPLNGLPLSGLPVEPTAVVGTLQQLTQAVPLSVPAVGTVSGDFHATTNFEMHHEADFTAHTTGTLTPALDDVTGDLGGTLDVVTSGDVLGGADATVHSVTSVVGDLTGGLGGTLHGVGSITGNLGLGGDTHATSDGHVHGGLLGGITDILH